MGRRPREVREIGARKRAPRPTAREWPKGCTGSREEGRRRARRYRQGATIPAKAKAKGKGAGAKGKGAAGGPAFFAKLKSLTQEERTQLRSPDTTEEEKSQLYKKAGLTDAEIEQMAEMRKNFGGGGGGSAAAAVAADVVAAADLPAVATGLEDRNSERMT